MVKNAHGERGDRSIKSTTKMKLKLLFLQLILFVSFIFPLKILATATSPEIFSRINSDIAATEDFVTKLETESDVERILDVHIPTYRKHLNESSQFYLSLISKEEVQALKNTLTKVNSSISGMSTSLGQLEQAANEGDEAAINQAAAKFDSYTLDLNSSIEELNSHFGLADYSWLLWPFLLSFVISFVLFVMSRGNPVLPAEQLRNQFEFALFKSSLWPLGGSAISYFWYVFTPPGSTFTIFWGPIAVGYFQFFRGLYTYITEARPAINLAKKEEKSKLEALIKSESFQKDSMEEKVKEIEKRTGVIDLSGDKKEEKNDWKFCKECGGKNSKAAKFCRECGYKF